VPQQVELIIEVADSTVDKDRNYKSILYALAGIKEYWIINIRDEQVEVYRNPDVASEAYLEVRRYRVDEAFESTFNGTTIVTDLLP
jgi:Uma2 family endonuclease